MPPARRAPSPLTTQICRFADGGRRCRRIATRDGFCGDHAAAIAGAAASSSFGEQLLGFVDRAVAARLRPYMPRAEATAMGGAVAAALGDAAKRIAQQPPRFRPQGWPGGQIPGAPPPPRAAPPPPAPPPPPVDALAEARDVLGFEPGEPVTRAAIKDRQRALARIFHPDTGTTKNPARMQKINAAADLLLRGAPP